MGTQTFLEASTSPGNKQTAPVHVPSLYLLSHPLAGCTFSNVDMSNVSHHSVYVSLSCHQLAVRQCPSFVSDIPDSHADFQVSDTQSEDRRRAAFAAEAKWNVSHEGPFAWGVGQIHAPKIDSLTISSTLW